MKTRPDSDSRIRAWLGRAFMLQVALISIAAVLGVFVASALLEGLLIRAALDDEVAHYWRQRDSRPAVPVAEHPQPARLLQDFCASRFARYATGLSRLEQGGLDYVVSVTERDHQRLYLVFDRTNVSHLAAYYGLVLLAAVLLVLYVSSWVSFRRLRRAVSPLIALARRVRELEDAPSNVAGVQSLQVPADADDEVRELTEALLRYSQRLAHFLERERQFTRDAATSCAAR